MFRERGNFLPEDEEALRKVEYWFGVQSYMIDIGPHDQDGLNVGTLGRDEGDLEVGVWPLLWSTVDHH